MLEKTVYLSELSLLFVVYATVFIRYSELYEEILVSSENLIFLFVKLLDSALKGRSIARKPSHQRITAKDDLLAAF